MTKKVLFALLRALILIIGITFLSFLLTFFAPGDPATIALKRGGMMVSEETIAAKREEMGLNDPFIQQYLRWLGNMFRGNMGDSYKTGKPVIQEIQNTIPYTFGLTIISMLITGLISMPVGILCAKHKDKWFDYLIRIVSGLFASIPSFFLALIFMYILALKLGLLPVIGDRSISGIIMPTLVLSLGLAPWYIRQVRSLVLKEMDSEYVEGLRTRAISERRILFCHVFKNCLFPIITLLGMSFGVLLGGSAIVESIFSWPGIGRLAVNAITARDYPIIQGYIVWMAIAFLLINLAVQLICQFLDPRLRKGAVFEEN